MTRKTIPSRARLIRLAGSGSNEPLRMRWFADTLAASADHRVVYHESHDEAGNAENSGRTIVVAVNGAPLVGDTRRYAEARVRFAAGMTLAAAPATPMFFMGEEVGASQPYRYDDVQEGRETRENYYALRDGAGANLFRFYADVIRLRLAHPALRSNDCDILHADDDNRVIAVRRWGMGEEAIVIGSLNNSAFRGGYRIEDSAYFRRKLARGVQQRCIAVRRRRPPERRPDHVRGRRHHRQHTRQQRARAAAAVSARPYHCDWGKRRCRRRRYNAPLAAAATTVRVLVEIPVRCEAYAGFAGGGSVKSTDRVVDYSR